MNIKHSETINLPIEKVWAKLSDVHYWIDNLENTEIVKQIDLHSYELKTKVSVGLFSIQMLGKVECAFDEKTNKIKLNIRQDSKTIQIQSLIMVSLDSKEALSTIINIDADIQLEGSMAGLASGMAEKVFDNLFQKLCSKIIET